MPVGLSNIIQLSVHFLWEISLTDAQMLMISIFFPISSSSNHPIEFHCIMQISVDHKHAYLRYEVQQHTLFQ